MCVTGRRAQILCKISYFSPNMQNYLTQTQLIRECEKIMRKNNYYLCGNFAYNGEY